MIRVEVMGHGLTAALTGMKNPLSRRRRCGDFIGLRPANIPLEGRTNRMARWLRSALLSSILLAAAAAAGAQEVAPTPPMGWNSWDAYGLTIDEAEFKANAAELAKLHAYGWTYAVIDEGWYMGNPFGDTLQHRDYAVGAHGLLVPSVKRFPSSADGQGFKAIADWVHAQGLKFGIHIVRGIPRQAVEAN